MAFMTVTKSIDAKGKKVIALDEGKKEGKDSQKKWWSRFTSQQTGSGDSQKSLFKKDPFSASKSLDQLAEKKCSYDALDTINKMFAENGSFTIS